MKDPKILNETAYGFNGPDLEETYKAGVASHDPDRTAKVSNTKLSRLYASNVRWVSLFRPNTYMTFVTYHGMRRTTDAPQNVRPFKSSEIMWCKSRSVPIAVVTCITLTVGSDSPFGLPSPPVLHIH